MSCTHWTRGLRHMLVACFVMFLSGCKDGGGTDPVFSTTELTVAGSVGDGPVINADLSFIDAQGTVIGQTTSDDQANYQFTVPELTPLPVRIVASGGTDLVTGRPLDFNLVGVLGEDAGGTASTLNLSPLSTMTVRALECTDARFNFRNLNDMWVQIRDQIGMGLDESLLQNPMFDDIGTHNVAAVVLSSEALAEVVRRTSIALSNAGFAVEAADVFSRIACDLALDHTIDGVGKGGDDRISAVFRAASVAVILEMIAGRLEVDGQPATALMDAAIAQILPAAAGQTVLSVEPSTELQDQLLKDLLLLQGQYDDAVLLDLIATVSASEAAALSRSVDAQLSDRSMQTLQSVLERIALADESQLRDIAIAMSQQPDRAAPYISFFTSQRRVLLGESAFLSWATTSADRCEASGAWSGSKTLEGSETLAAPRASGDYVLTCFSSGGSSSASVRVEVINDSGEEQLPDPESQPEPPPPQSPEDDPVSGLDVSLQASDSVVAPGGSVQLSWTSAEATRCDARGGWSGAKSLSGQATVGPLSQSTTFELACSNAEGTSSALVRVEVVDSGTLTLEWNAPTTYEDGSTLGQVAAYKVYYGQSSGQYSDVAQVDDGSARSISLSVPSATYYVVMTAIDANGFESSRSNEIQIQSR